MPVGTAGGVWRGEAAQHPGVHAVPAEEVISAVLAVPVGRVCLVGTVQIAKGVWDCGGSLYLLRCSYVFEWLVSAQYLLMIFVLIVLADRSPLKIMKYLL
jgi:hypothetical protein